MVDKKTPEAINEQRIIKKYPNRRLYDTKHSQYITLHDVHEMVKKNRSFKVIDAKTAKDLTRNTLLQIIYEQEENTYPLFTPELLKSIISFYEEPMHGMLSRYLEHSIGVFKEHLTDLKSPMNSLLASDTRKHLLHDLAESSINDLLVADKKTGGEKG